VQKVQVSLHFIGQQGLGYFFRPFLWSLFPIAGGLCKFNTNDGGKRPIQRQPLKHQADQLLSMHNYTPRVISGNDKNKQPTLLGQHKLALTT